MSDEAQSARSTDNSPSLDMMINFYVVKRDGQQDFVTSVAGSDEDHLCKYPTTARQQLHSENDEGKIESVESLHRAEHGFEVYLPSHIDPSVAEIVVKLTMAIHLTNEEAWQLFPLGQLEQNLMYKLGVLEACLAIGVDISFSREIEEQFQHAIEREHLSKFAFRVSRCTMKGCAYKDVRNAMCRTAVDRSLEGTMHNVELMEINAYCTRKGLRPKMRDFQDESEKRTLSKERACRLALGHGQKWT